MQGGLESGSCREGPLKSAGLTHRQLAVQSGGHDDPDQVMRDVVAHSVCMGWGAEGSPWLVELRRTGQGVGPAHHP